MPKYANRARTKFDPFSFGVAINRKVKAEHSNLAEVSRTTGVPPSTVTRLTYGKAPSIDNFIALLHWGGWDAREFMIESVVQV